MNIETKDKSLMTVDVVDVSDAVETSTSQRDVGQAPSIETAESPVRSEEERLAPLFSPDAAKGFRADWDTVQISFVDDPKQAVRKADALVAEVMKSLAQSFSDERAKLELDQTDEASTENLRVALRRYRSFFHRLLSL